MFIKYNGFVSNTVFLTSFILVNIKIRKYYLSSIKSLILSTFPVVNPQTALIEKWKCFYW